MVRISYISDIHLEFFKGDVPNIRNTDKSDVLVLAGDIGYPRMPSYEQFLKICSEEWSKGLVLVVAGNHEYYSSNRNRAYIDEIDDMIEDKCNEVGDNVIFLQNSHIDYMGMRFVGSTLWYDGCLEPYNQWKIDQLNDYKYIFGTKIIKPDVFHRGWVTPFLLKPDDVYYLNEKATIFFTQAVSSSPFPVVCISHHPPTQDITNEFGYCNRSLNDIFSNPNLKLWIFGHRHQDTPVVINKNNVLLVSNTIGYPDEFDVYRDSLRTIDI